MAKHRDYYEDLGVSRNATADEIRRAYRRLARTCHPDVSEDPDAASRFSELTEAYEVLIDPEKRKAYDRFGQAGVRGGPGGVGAGGGGSGGAGVDMSDVSSIFEEMFGGRGGSPFGGRGGSPFGEPSRPRSAPQKGRDLEHELAVSFVTAARGGTEHIRLATPRGGETRTIKVRIPPGSESGARLRVKGAGDPHPLDGRQGDLILKINIGKHPLFRRDGLDLLIDLPITMAEAALGATVRVPLLEGSAEIKIPPGAGSGQKLRIKGKGVTDAKGKTGDFFAVLQIAAPGNLSERAKGLFHDLADELQNPRESGPWADIRDRSPDPKC